MLNLAVEVIKVELVLLDFALEFAGLLFIELLLRPFHQRYNVTHAQYTVGHTRRMEQVDGFHLFADTYKLDGLVHHRANAERSTTTGVAIQFGKYHAGIVETIVKLLGSGDSILSGHRIHH